MGTTRVRISIDIENTDAEDEIKQREDKRLAQALKYGIECSASIEELASLCFQSVSTFKRKFRARYSISPHQWLLQQKLEIALHIDLIPDFIPILGFTDDAAALAAALKTIKSSITPEIEAKAKSKAEELF